MIGQWVAEALEHANIKQAELARRLHHQFGWADDRSMINKILKGRRDVSASEMMEISEITGFPLPTEATGSPGDIPVMGFLGAGAEIQPDFEQVPPEGLYQVNLPFPLPAEMIAFEVRGDSMLPVYKDGHVIVVYKESHRPLHSFYGEDAAVKTSDGRRFIKTIQRGTNGNVNLFSFNAPLMEDVRLEWIGEIFVAMPRAQINAYIAEGSKQTRRQAEYDEELVRRARSLESTQGGPEILDRFVEAVERQQSKSQKLGTRNT
jgi:repressor LexA